MPQQQPKSYYTHDQFVKLKNYIEFLYDCFMWNYRFEDFKLFVSFTDFNVSGDEFVDEFIKLRTSTVTEFNQLMHELENSFKPAIKFLIDVRAFEFGNILCQTSEDCDVFVADELLKSIEENSRD